MEFPSLKPIYFKGKEYLPFFLSKETVGDKSKQVDASASDCLDAVGRAQVSTPLSEEEKELVELSQGTIPDKRMKNYRDFGFINQDTIRDTKRYMERGIDFQTAFLTSQLKIGDFECAQELAKLGLNYSRIESASNDGAEYVEIMNLIDFYGLEKFLEANNVKRDLTVDIPNIAAAKKAGCYLSTVEKINAFSYGADGLNRDLGYYLGENIYDMAVDIIESGGDAGDVMDLARQKIKQAKYEKFVETGLDESDAEDLSTLYDGRSDEEINKLADFIKVKGADPHFAAHFATNRRMCEAFEEALKKGVPPKIAQLDAYFNNLGLSYMISMGDRAAKQLDFAKRIADENYKKNITDKIANPILKEHTAKVLDYVTGNPVYITNLYKSDLSPEEISELVVKFAKSSLKNAIKRPNQYLSGIPIEHSTKVQGKYPSLSEDIAKKYQREFDRFSAAHLGIILKAEKYLDSDTINQLMDKRTENFAEALLELAQLNPENYALVKDLMCLNNKEGKALTAKEKIQLSKIIYYFQQGRINTSELADLEYVDVEGLKKSIITKALLNMGFGEDEISEIPPDKLDFDEEYAWALLASEDDKAFDFFYFMIQDSINDKKRKETLIEQAKAGGENEQAIEIYKFIIDNIKSLTEEEVFKLYRKMMSMSVDSRNLLDKVVTIAVRDDFKSYIQNEGNFIGKANKKTKEAFLKSGLDYDKWFNSSSFENENFTYGDKNLTLKLWERRPQKDLFMGNRTNCCTALGGGGSSTATPVYLLSSAFNVVDLEDESGNIVGMSRIHFAKIDNEESLVMDNIELNPSLIKGKSEKEIEALRDKFFEYNKKFASSITGKENTPVYFSTSYAKVPVRYLNKVQKKVEFTGEPVNSGFYSNVAAKWLTPEELKGQLCELYTV